MPLVTYRFHLASAIAAALLAASLIVGCGSSDSDETSLTKAQFIKQGDAICKKVDEQRIARLNKFLSSHSRAYLTTNAGEEEVTGLIALQPLETKLDGLADLGTPSGDEELVDPIISGLEKAIDEAEENPSQIEANYNAIFGPVNQAARQYGFKVCSRIL